MLGSGYIQLSPSVLSQNYPTASLLIPVIFTISELNRIRGVQLPEGRGARGAASLRFFMENLVGCSQDSMDGGSPYQLYTPPKFKMEPENNGFQWTFLFAGIYFQVLCWISGVYGVV